VEKTNESGNNEEMGAWFENEVGRIAKVEKETVPENEC
jgi:hypothetical protein